MTKPIRGVNWNSPEDDYTLTFWQQNVMQFWTDEEIPLSDDKSDWEEMSDLERETYKKNLGGLTLLDTIQGGVGMPKILEHVEGLQRKAVLGFMGMMEQIHAKSYSSIFTTLAPTEEIDEIFEWIKNNALLQYKASRISKYYNSITGPKELYLAMSASVFLESFLFYSGFFYPLYRAGHGKMTNSGEIINLILRDESIHGLYVGALAQEIFDTFSEEDQNEVTAEVYSLLTDLMDNEVKYTYSLYSQVGLAEEVVEYVKYNANKALQNLGLKEVYEVGEVNPIVMNGINTSTKQHDFFSKKGNGYIRTLNVEPLTDEDFIF